MSWPTRQQIAGRIDQVIAAAVAILAGWVGIHAVQLGFVSVFVGAVLVASLATIGFARAGRRAVRGRIGELSERVVRHALKALAGIGWRVVHSVRWPQHGDIDHVAIAPSGTTFVIETKTRSYTSAHLARTLQAAAAVQNVRPDARVHAVLCVVRSSASARYENGVLVVSADRLVRALRRLERYEDAAAAIA